MPLTPLPDALKAAETYDETAARREGWHLTEPETDGHGGLRCEIHRVSEQPGPGLLDCDRDAWVFVTRRAREGSALHRAALDLVDPVEREFIAMGCGDWTDELPA